jgi:hypothetical protein
MPVVLRRDGIRFFFYANEGEPIEPPHIHLEQGGMEAKFWLTPDVHLAYADGFDARSQRRLLAMITADRDKLLRAWNEFFG